MDDLPAHPSIDLPGLLLGRFGSRQDDSTVGFYDRRHRRFATSTQHEFLDRAAGTADHLEAAGVECGDRIMIAASTPEALWLGFLGAVLAEAVPLLLPIRPTLDGPDDIADGLRTATDALPDAHLLVQVGAKGPCIDTAGRSWLPFDPEVSPGDAVRRLEDCRGEPDRPLHLQLTSGSTGVVKPVILTHENVVASTWSLARRMEVQPGDHVVSWLPLYHDMGLVGMALLALTSGADLRLLSPFDFLADPSHWLEAISNGRGVITSAPNFAFDYTTRRAPEKRLEGLDLRSWKKCYCGAEPVDSATVATFIERFSAIGLKPEAVQPTYGLAEATLMVTMPRTGDEPHQLEITLDSISVDGEVTTVAEVAPLSGPAASSDSAPSTTVVSLGVPAEEMGVEIVGVAGNSIDADDHCGEVVVTGPAVSPGYLLPDGSIEPFENRCRTGDIGFMHAGELYLVERIKNIIIKNGQNYSTVAIERTVTQHLAIPLDNCAVTETSIVGAGSSVVAVIERPRGADATDLIAAVRDAARARDLPIDEVVVVARRGIPRTTSGKKQHAHLRAALRSGAVKVLERRTMAADRADEDVIDIDLVEQDAQILSLVERHARRRGWLGTQIKEDQHLAADLGFDSLALIELSVDMELEVGRSLAEDRLGELEIVADVLRLSVDGEDGVGLTAMLHDLVDKIPQLYRRVDGQVARQLRIDGRWITDLGSLNYLGLDLHPAVIESVAPAVERWGVHPSWTRAVASPSLYFDLEEATAKLIGAPDVMVFSTITLLHFGVLPKLATPSDTLIVDHGAHNSIHEAAELTAARGAMLRSFDHNRPETLESALQMARGRPVIALNGVYSMTGGLAPLHEIHDLAVRYGAVMYVDDAHGFGILGEPRADHPYGSGGGGAIAHAGLPYDNVFYVGGFSKAFSSMAAFVTCRNRDDRARFETASTSIFSGPVPIASMASALAGLKVNETEGDERRRVLHALSARLISGVRERGYVIDNELTFPIVNVVEGKADRVIAASEILWDHGLLFTPSVFPAAPLDRGGFRLSLTADNTIDDVDQLLVALDAVQAKLGPTSDVGERTLIREI